MKKLTITVETDSQVSLLEEMLKQIDFVSSIEVADDKLSSDEIRMLENRMEDYEKNKHDILYWENVLPELLKRYGI